MTTCGGPARQAGRRTAVVTQDHDLDNDFSVEETVAMGRLPHKGLLERDAQSDRDIVHDALSRVGMDWAGNRVFARLSGGERQRVLVARALTQQAPVLLLDEPTNHLDVGSPADVLTTDRVAEVFGVLSAIVAHPLTGRPHFVTAPVAATQPTQSATRSQS